MTIDPVGHVLIFGETNSGKTYFAKHFIKKLNPRNVYVFTQVPTQWDDTEYEIIGPKNFDKDCERVMNICEQRTKKQREHAASLNVEFLSSSPFIVVFDDFNDAINTTSNDNYKQLFNRGRHNGIRVMNLAHNSHAIGPTARANTRYAIIMASTSDDELEKLADCFWSKNHMHLKQLADDARKDSMYIAIMLDKRNKTFVYEDAKPKVTPVIPVRRGDGPNNILSIDTREGENLEFLKTHGVVANIDTSLLPGAQPQHYYQHQMMGDTPYTSQYYPKSPTTHDIEIQTELSDDSVLLQNPGQAGYLGVGAPSFATNMGNKQAHNLVDNSNNVFNVNHNIKMKQMIEANKIRNEIELENLDHKRQYDEKREALAIRDIIYKQFKTPTEERMIAECLNKNMRPRRPYTTRDYEEGIPIFMKRNFNETYDPRIKDKRTALLNAAGGVFLARDDPVQLIQSGYNMGLDLISSFMSDTASTKALLNKPENQCHISPSEERRRQERRERQERQERRDRMDRNERYESTADRNERIRQENRKKSMGSKYF